MLVKQSHFIKQIVFLGVILLIIICICFSLIVFWKTTSYDKSYRLDVFTDEDYNVITEVFDLPNEIEAELIEITVDEFFRDNSATLIFSVKKNDIMRDYLSQSFKDPIVPSKDEDNSNHKILMNGKEFYETGSYGHKIHSGNIREYVSDERSMVYCYTIIHPGSALREIVKKNGDNISKAPD